MKKDRIRKNTFFVKKKKKKKERKITFSKESKYLHSISEKKNKTDGEKKNKHITFSLDSDWSQKKSPKQLSLLPDKIVDSKRYLERNGRTMTPINLWIHLSMIGQTARFSSAAMEFTLFRTERQQEPYFPWMAARYLASNSIPNSSPFIILRILRERVTRSFRFLACWKKKERERKKKGNRLPFAGTHRIAHGENRVSRKDARWSHIRRCAVFYRSECRFANVTVQTRTTTFCSFIVLSRGERGKKRKKKEAKEKSWIKFSKARVSIHRTLIYATLVHAYWACSNDSVAVVTWLITFTVKFCDKMLR